MATIETKEQRSPQPRFEDNKEKAAKLEQTNDSSLKNFFALETRDQTKPGFLFFSLHGLG